MVMAARLSWSTPAERHEDTAGHSDSGCAESSRPRSSNKRQPYSTEAGEEDGDEGALPVLPGEIMRDILAHLAVRWARRPVLLAKEEIREWTQYTLVCKEWQALFQAQPLCVVFDEAPSRQQVKWLRTTRTPIRRITFLPSCMPCKSTLSTAPAQLANRSAGDTIQLRRNPLERMESGGLGRMAMGTVA